MTLSIEDFDKALKQIKRNELDEKMHFLKNHVSLFKNSRPNPTALRKLAGAFDYYNCTRDCLVIKEGDPASNVYVIIEGDFIVTKKVYSNDLQAEDINKIKEDPLKAREQQSKFNRKNNQRKIDNHIFNQITDGQLIGEDDVRLQYETYQTTVKCISQKAKLMVVSREDFIGKLHNMPASYALLSSEVEKKLTS